MSDTADAERIYKALAQDGTVLMPLEKTFWAARFGRWSIVSAYRGRSTASDDDMSGSF